MSKQATEADREYLRVAEVAKAFHVSPKTVARWADEGRIPFVLTLGGHRRFPRKEIEELLPK
jgi:excisionase family DNA binding protein